jgi:hypothetical protein
MALCGSAMELLISVTRNRNILFLEREAGRIVEENTKKIIYSHVFCEKSVEAIWFLILATRNLKRAYNT